MQKGTVSTRASPSAVLAIIGGALMVTGGILVPSMLGIWIQGGLPGWMGAGSIMRCQGCGPMMSGSSFMWTAVGVVSAISIGSGVVSIIGGYSIYKKPESSSKWGVAILIASIVGLIGMSGFFIGPILGIIGGILALTMK
jgi:hypothetical protein